MFLSIGKKLLTQVPRKNDKKFRKTGIKIKAQLSCFLENLKNFEKTRNEYLLLMLQLHLLQNIHLIQVLHMLLPQAGKQQMILSLTTMNTIVIIIDLN
jgi:Rps23 Pro-64 3,4-dihydroxylase Tpa1-like proline 4-hydroxylase